MLNLIEDKNFCMNFIEIFDKILNNCSKCESFNSNYDNDNDIYYNRREYSRKSNLN
jgi:hypothetical protein